MTACLPVPGQPAGPGDRRDDIVFLDFGPIFAEWEADFGRTFVLGDDPLKLRLQADLPRMFAAGRALFEGTPTSPAPSSTPTSSGWREEAGWEFGGVHCGHLVGEFPHERIDGERIESYIAPATPPDAPHRQGRPAAATGSWRSTSSTGSGGIGGFHEQLLTLRC